MGKARRDVRIRLAKANSAIDRCERSIERHEKLAMRAEAEGVSPDRHTELAQRAKNLLCRHIATAERLKPHASRADSAERRGARLTAANVLPPKSARVKRDEERQAKSRAANIASRARALSAAAVEYDPSTARGQRDLQVDSMGHTNRARSLSGPRLFDQRGSDATPLRVATCVTFENVWHHAHEGDFPEPKFEPQTSAGTYRESSHPHWRAQSKLCIERIQNSLGHYLYAVLEQRVIYNSSFRAIGDMVGRDRSAIPAVFAMAVDLAARELNMEPDEPKRSRIRSWSAPPEPKGTTP